MNRSYNREVERMSARNTCGTTQERCVIIVTFNSAAHIGDCLGAMYEELDLLGSVLIT